MKKDLSTIMLLGVAVLLAAFPLNADSVGPDCATCLGGVYTLNQLASTGDTRDLEFIVDTTGYTGDSLDWLESLSVRVSSQTVLSTTLLNATVHSPTLPSTDAPGSWEPLPNSVSNGNECDARLGRGWACFHNAADTVADEALRAFVGSIYTFQFRVTLQPGSSLLDPSPISVTYFRMDENRVRQTAGIVSERVSVPEGTTGELPLLLCGLAGLWVWHRSRSQRTSGA